MAGIVWEEEEVRFSGFYLFILLDLGFLLFLFGEGIVWSGFFVVVVLGFFIVPSGH